MRVTKEIDQMLRWVQMNRADHYPVTRKKLVILRLDPNDPRCRRGLCEWYHNTHTAQSSNAK